MPNTNPKIFVCAGFGLIIRRLTYLGDLRQDLTCGQLHLQVTCLQKGFQLGRRVQVKLQVVRVRVYSDLLELMRKVSDRCVHFSLYRIDGGLGREYGRARDVNMSDKKISCRRYFVRCCWTRNHLLLARPTPTCLERHHPRSRGLGSIISGLRISHHLLRQRSQPVHSKQNGLVQFGTS
jgi:hypothetical protein